jgi:exopolysaccharide biosynthesis polyprenyl glycosylphosphotransferase
LLRDRAGLLSRAIWWVDVSIVVGVFLGALAFYRPGGILARDEAELLRLSALGIASCGIWPLLFERLGLYESQRRRDLASVLGSLAIAAPIALATIAVTAFVARVPVPLAFPIVCGGAQLAALALQRTLILVALRVVRRAGGNARYVMIVGSGPRARQVSHRIAAHPEWGLHVIGYLDDAGAPVASDVPPDLIFKPQDFERLLRERVIDEVIVACPRSMLASVGYVVGQCAATGIPVTLLADLFGDYLPPPRITRLGAQAVLSFAPVHHGRLELAIKRAIDVVGSALALALLSPVLGLAALAVRMTSPGPILFRQTRCGLHGRHFQVLKLRTMVDGAEQIQAAVLALNEMDGPVFKVRDDPRVTPVGRVLRRFSIDEVPQLWNVLRGDMSLVGPRPPIPGEVSHYDLADRRRLSMRPGITCIWQVSGRNQIGFEEWVKLDLAYIDSWSLGLDLLLLLRTIPAVLSGRGAS